MKKIFIFGVLILFLIGFVAARPTITSSVVEECVTEDGTCGTIAGLVCCSGLTCQLEGDYTDASGTCVTSQKICCHIYGLGSMMKKVNSRYQEIEEADCVVPEDFVGGGREIVNDEYCENQTQARVLTQAQIQNIIKSQNRIRANVQTGECPINCTCTGSVTTCQLENKREVTIKAGNSGNTIVQVKGVNMTTNVTLYKSEEKVYGVFKNNETREIKVLPDGIKEKIKQRIKAKLENHTIELDENGTYQVQVQKKARLFFMFQVRENIRVQIDSETGEVIQIRNPWWGFLARDVKEEIVGGCGTVTPGLENECCQNLGYDSWNSESLECE